MKKWLLSLLFPMSLFAATPADTVWNWSGGTSGNAVDLTTLGASTVGDAGVWTIADSGGLIRYTNFAYQALGGSFTVSGYGVINGSGTVGVSILADGANDDAHVLIFYPTKGGGQSGPSTSTTVAGAFQLFMSDLSTNALGRQHDAFWIKGQQVGFAGPGDYINAYVNNVTGQGDKEPWFGLESPLLSPTARLAGCTALVWYAISEKMVRGESNRIAFFVLQTNTWVQLGYTNGQQDGVSYPNSIQFHYHQSVENNTHLFYGAGACIFTNDTAAVPWPYLPDPAILHYTNVFVNGVIRNYISQ